MAQAKIDRTYFITDISGIEVKVASVTRAEANDLADKIEALLTQWNADHNKVIAEEMAALALKDAPKA